MSSTISRTFRSIPFRDAATTWHAIVALLTQGKNASAEKELSAITGVAASVIADAAPREAPIIVTCDGPRTRIYCTYDDDALDDSESSENSLGFDPLQGDWHLSLPCAPDDLEWVQRSLKTATTRVTARDMATGLVVEEARTTDISGGLVLNREALFK